MPEVSGRQTEEPGARARRFFEGLWQQGDFWKLESSDFEREKYLRQLALIPDRRLRSCLEIGCGAGAFTALLADRADEVLAIDISPTAIRRARRLRHLKNVEFRVADVMDFDFREGPEWDLVVLSETIYYLGWLFSFFDIGWLAHQIFESVRDEGCFLMANTLQTDGDYLMRPWLIYTYRDLFRNVGFTLSHQDTVHGLKDEVELSTLVSLFVKRPLPSGAP